MKGRPAVKVRDKLARGDERESREELREFEHSKQDALLI